MTSKILYSLEDLTSQPFVFPYRIFTYTLHKALLVEWMKYVSSWCQKNGVSSQQTAKAQSFLGFFS